MNKHTVPLLSMEALREATQRNDEAILRDAWRSLGLVGASIIPARIVGQPDAADVGKVFDDMEIIEREFGKLLAAYKDYIGSSLANVDEAFTSAENLMSDAFGEIRGRLTDIEDDLRDSYEDTLAEIANEMRRA